MSPLPRSLGARLLVASLVLLPVVLGATGWVLERAHRGALQAALDERLQLQVLALLAQAEFAEEFRLPLLPLEPRLLQPNSGLYALVSDGGGRPLWLSPSAALLPQPLEKLSAGIPALPPGERYASERDGLWRHAYQVLWEGSDGADVPLRLVVAESTEPRDADLAAYRGQLLLWLGATLLLLLAAQALILRWGLLPLEHISAAVARVEAGESSTLPGPWPSEVQPLADNLNTLLQGEQRRRERTRNTLADLAHSLKTPLAVLRSADAHAEGHAALLEEQVQRMEEVVQWHLQRASGGSARLLQRVPVGPTAARLRETLLKVYADRDLEIVLDCPQSARFRGDERDLMELLGNLLDNGCKYADSRVALSVSGGTAGEPLQVVVEDDGEGISPELRDLLLTRGARADTRREGQGIGLSVVLEIVRAQHGELQIGDSALGGARVSLRLA
jgi:two-component system sensor histidine kinase PhoQ